MYRNLNPHSLGISARHNELIEHSLSYKFESFDLDFSEFAQQVENHGVEHARRFLDSANIRLGSFELPVRWQGEIPPFKQDMTSLNKYAELAAQVGATRCYTQMPAGCDVAYNELFDTLRERCAEVAGVLSQHGIQLGISFLAAAEHQAERTSPFISTAEALVAFVKTVDLPNVGICLDTWDWHVGGGTIEQLRELPADKIIIARLADLPAGVAIEPADDEQRVLPTGEGVVPVHEIAKYLQEIGFDGPIAVHPHPARFKGRPRGKTVKLAAKSLDQSLTGQFDKPVAPAAEEAAAATPG